MRRRHALFLPILLAALDIPPAEAQESAPARVPKILVYTVSAGFEHDVVRRGEGGRFALVEEEMIRLGRETGDFEAEITRDAAAFSKTRLAGIDGILFYTTGELPLDAEQREAFFAFVREGGAFVGVHSATDTFYQVPEYGEMIGGWFDGHPWHEKVRIRVEDSSHPATRHLGEAFEITDEIYQFRAPWAREKLHVLLSLDPSAVDLRKSGARRTDDDYAVAWWREWGKGRVFYTSLGHRPEVWKDPRFRKHLAAGISFALRREPRAGRPETGRRSAPLPVAPPGFAVDLLAEMPDIYWPAAVHALPDGSLLVAEDPMDMPGPTDRPIDRILRLVFRPDGGIERTVFAENLFAVFGIEEQDGHVFAMNMPHLTRLRDADGDGVAEEREEILRDLGPPAPGWPGGFNDHIVSGIRFGMDGFLYIAVGDKGIPGATGADGSRVVLRGGGIVRVRPDGTELEVVATGTRNQLDVALDERDRIFTFDNTDDGLGWWTRFAHILPGGFYGYPWDYAKHPERALPCLAEYGGGSPTGGLVYRAAAWPAPFRGSVFFCEWGKGQIRRFEVAPAGAGFRVAHDEDFVTAGGVTSFRPVDICESPGGRFLYVSDWGHGGWQEPVRTGRLFRIRRADDAGPPADPLPPADPRGPASELGDPSFPRRTRAARELARQGGDALPVLAATLAEGDAVAARHALWALSEIRRRSGAGTRARVDSLLAEAAASGDAPTRAEALRVAGTLRLRDMADAVAGGLRDQDPDVMREAALAAARLGDRRVTDALLAALPKAGDRFLRFAMRRAIAAAGDPVRVAAALLHARPADLDEILLAWHDTADAEIVRAAADVASGSGAAHVRAAVLLALAPSHRRAGPWDGKWWGIQPAKKDPPAKTVSWEGTDIIVGAVRRALLDPSPVVAGAAARSVAVMKDATLGPDLEVFWRTRTEPELRIAAAAAFAALRYEGAAPLLAEALENRDVPSAVRQAVVRAAAAIGTAPMVDLLAAAAAGGSLEEEGLVACIGALEKLGAARAAPVLVRRLQDPREGVRGAAIDALGSFGPGEHAGALRQLLGEEAMAARAATALARMRCREAVPELMDLASGGGDEAAAAAAVALCEMPDARALDLYLDRIVSRKPALRAAARTALGTLRDDVRGEIERRHAEGRLPGTVLAEVRRIYAELEPIRRWHVIGPFPRDADAGISGQPVDLAATHTGIDGRKLAWIPVDARASDGFVDLEAIFDPDQDVMAWAFAEVGSGGDREAEAAAGSDDQLSIWVEGRPVHRFDGARAWRVDEDRFTVPLRAGGNGILVRIGQGGGQWAFNLKIGGEGKGPLFEERGTSGAVPGDFRAFAASHAGDAARGRRIFFEEGGPSCIRCHKVAGEGATVGPDLTDVGARYARPELITSVLEPSSRIAEGYRAEVFWLRDGRILEGRVESEQDGVVVLVDPQARTHRLRTADVEERRESSLSAMAEGLVLGLAPGEFADLIAFLESLKGATPGGSAGQRR